VKTSDTDYRHRSSHGTSEGMLLSGWDAARSSDRKSTQAPHADPYGVCFGDDDDGAGGGYRRRRPVVTGPAEDAFDALESLTASTVLPPRGGTGVRDPDDAPVSQYELDSYIRRAVDVGDDEMAWLMGKADAATRPPGRSQEAGKPIASGPGFHPQDSGVVESSQTEACCGKTLPNTRNCTERMHLRSRPTRTALSKRQIAPVRSVRLSERPRNLPWRNFASFVRHDATRQHSKVLLRSAETRSQQRVCAA
jgi:hypothetical protein